MIGLLGPTSGPISKAEGLAGCRTCPPRDWRAGGLWRAPAGALIRCLSLHENTSVAAVVESLAL